MYGWEQNNEDRTLNNGFVSLADRAVELGFVSVGLRQARNEIEGEGVRLPAFQSRCDPPFLAGNKLYGN